MASDIVAEKEKEASASKEEERATELSDSGEEKSFEQMLEELKKMKEQKG